MRDKRGHAEECGVQGKGERERQREKETERREISREGKK